MRKKAIFILILAVLGILGYNYLYQDHRDIASEEPDFIVSSLSIVNEFSVNAQESEQKYIDKTLEISGTITELNVGDLTLDDAVFCQFSNAISNLEIGQEIKLKGRLIGFDDLLEQVKLNECSFIK